MDVGYITKDNINYVMDVLMSIIEGFAAIFWQFLNSDFFIAVLSTLIGAALAFFFGLILYKRQKDLENKTTLHFFISALTALLSNLYSFKEQIVQHRYKECLECKNIIETSPQPELQIRHMSQYIYGGDLEWPITQEKLEFLAMPDPNVITLSGVLRGSIKTLNTMIVDLNEDIKCYVRSEKQLEQLDPSDFKMMIIKNELLYEQLDSALYLTNLLIDVLIKFGSVVFGKEMKIKAINLTHEKYKAIQPKPIESWEGRDWFPENKK